MKRSSAAGAWPADEDAACLAILSQVTDQGSEIMVMIPAGNGALRFGKDHSEKGSTLDNLFDRSS